MRFDSEIQIPSQQTTCIRKIDVSLVVEAIVVLPTPSNGKKHTHSHNLKHNVKNSLRSQFTTIFASKKL